MVVRRASARLVLPLLATGTLACGLVMGFDGYDTSPPRYAVQGTVDGLEGADAAARVSVNGGPKVALRNGPFVVENAIAGDTDFSFDVEADEHVCAVDRAPMAPFADATVNVHCRTTNARLAALTFSVGSLEPGFDSALDSYHVRAPLLDLIDTMGTAKPESPSATLAVEPLGRTGAPGAGVSFALEGTPVTLRVTPAAGPTHARTYGLQRAAATAYVKPANTMQSALFGSALALSGDTFAVGAYGESSGSTGIDSVSTPQSNAYSGAAYVFRRSGGSWAQEAYIKSSDSPTKGEFGRALALAGDTLVVSAPLVYDGFTYGHVYVFQRSGSKWTEVQRLTMAASSSFGRSIALFDDVLAVGATDFGDGHGIVHVFRRVAGVWTPEATLTEPPPLAGLFGRALALTRDRLVVGAPATTAAGATYVFRRSGSTWPLEKTFLPSAGTAAGSYFGASVSATDDAIAVGAPLDPNAAAVDGGAPVPSAAGSVSVYRLAGGSWVDEAHVRASNPQLRAQFGASVALSAQALVATAPFERGSAMGIDGDPYGAMQYQGAGAAYVFTRVGGGWSQRAYVKATNSRSDAHFGAALATDGRTLVVGADQESSAATGIDGPQNDETAPQAGAVYVY